MCFHPYGSCLTFTFRLCFLFLTFGSYSTFSSCFYISLLTSSSIYFHFFFSFLVLVWLSFFAYVFYFFVSHFCLSFFTFVFYFSIMVLGWISLPASIFHFSFLFFVFCFQLLLSSCFSLLALHDFYFSFLSFIFHFFFSFLALDFFANLNCFQLLFQVLVLAWLNYDCLFHISRHLFILALAFHFWFLFAFQCALDALFIQTNPSPLLIFFACSRFQTFFEVNLESTFIFSNKNILIRVKTHYDGQLVVTNITFETMCF